MKRNKLVHLLVATGVVASSLALTTGSAQAATGSFRDRRGDAAAKVDITKVDLTYTAKRVSVRLHLRDFAGFRDTGNGYEVWIDSSSTTDKRPDYKMALMSQELYAGRTSGWAMLPGRIPGTNFVDPYGGIPIFWSGSRTHDYLNLAVPTTRINNPAKVRVAVTVRRWDARGHTRSADHLVARHRFTRWVARA